MDGTSSSTKIRYTLDKDRFLQEMTARGWEFHDAYGWLCPQTKGITKRMMEEHWIESILASVQCHHEG